MEFILKLLSVFSVGLLELIAAVPLGFVLKLNPLLNAVISMAASLSGAIIVLFIGEKIRAWIIKKRGAKAENKESRIRRIWDKYGMIGLGLIAPLLTGVPLAAALAITFGASKKNALLWLGIGIFSWTIILVGLSFFGLKLF